MVSLSSWSTLAGVLAFSALLCACDAQRDGELRGRSAAGTLSGTVTYRERMALPTGATIEVRLEDVSRADAPADVIAEQTISADGRQVPIPFELEYEAATIDPNRRYGLRAAIRGPNDVLMFSTTAHHAVLEPGAALSGIELLVQRVASGGAGGGPPTAGVAGSQGVTESIVSGPWRLIAMTRAGGEPERVPREPPYTIEFGADGRYNGQAHCNRYMGSYARPAADRLAMSAGAATLAACGEPSIADEYLRTVAAATRYVVRGDELELTTDDGRALTFVRESPQAAAPEVGRTFVFDCDTEERFVVRTGPGEVAVWAPPSAGNQYVVLGSTESAPGARYADGDTVFWNRGELATLEIAGRSFRDCRSNPAAVPWADAKRRGATFRALGNEPAWSLEVHAQRLVLVTSLGAEHAELVSRGPVVDGAQTTYRAAQDGRELTAVIVRQPCADTMSGEAFEASATVTFGEEVFRGCGRFL